MTQPLDEMRRQPEIVRAQLPVVFALAEGSIGKGLAVGIDQLVSLQLIVEGERVQQHMRMLDPKWIVGDQFDLVRRLHHPAFSPGIDDPVFRGPIGQESERQLQDYGIAVLSGSRVDARIDEAKIAVFVLAEAVATPGQGTSRQILFQAVSPMRQLLDRN